MSGLFIALEGICGAGKTTQGTALRLWLAELGYDTVDVRAAAEATPAGAHLRSLVASAEIAGALPPLARALAVAADRAYMVDTIIRPALTRGAAVVADRYHLTNLVNQGMLCGVGSVAVQMLETAANGGLLPDLTVVLDCPGRTALQRLSDPDYWEARGTAFLEEMREGYLDAVRACPTMSVMVVDASRSRGRVLQDIQTLVRPLLEVR
jgi:dTMP kinase